MPLSISLASLSLSLSVAASEFLYGEFSVGLSTGFSGSLSGQRRLPLEFRQSSSGHALYMATDRPQPENSVDQASTGRRHAALRVEALDVRVGRTRLWLLRSPVGVFFSWLPIGTPRHSLDARPARPATDRRTQAALQALSSNLRRTRRRPAPPPPGRLGTCAADSHSGFDRAASASSFQACVRQPRPFDQPLWSPR